MLFTFTLFLKLYVTPWVVPNEQQHRDVTSKNKEEGCQKSFFKSRTTTNENKNPSNGTQVVYDQRI